MLDLNRFEAIQYENRLYLNKPELSPGAISSNLSSVAQFLQELWTNLSKSLSATRTQELIPVRADIGRTSKFNTEGSESAASQVSAGSNQRHLRLVRRA